jgi:hypothetical protein
MLRVRARRPRLQLILPGPALQPHADPARWTSAARSYEAWAKSLDRPAAGARALRAQPGARRDDARREPVAVARGPARAAWRSCASCARACRSSPTSRAGKPGSTTPTTTSGCSRRSAGARQRPPLHQRRHALRGAVAARRPRAVSALGPDLERPHRGLARAPPNALRVGECVPRRNFGWIEIDWAGPTPSVRLQVRDIEGRVRIEQALDVASLRA